MNPGTRLALALCAFGCAVLFFSIIDYFKQQRVRSSLRAAALAIRDFATVAHLAKPQKWDRPKDDGFHDLTQAQVEFMWEKNACPYCHTTPLYKGPEGGLSTNCFCGNPDCNSRFNITLPGMIGFPMAGSAPVPAWGQFTGTCPDDFLEWRRAELSKEKTDERTAT